jgi:2-polyprenyl-3-methyl-5-hydroxy-6-metoxy-1,4-benzoquinol methylase
MTSTSGGYDESASEYAVYVARREEGGAENDPLDILPHLLPLLGNLMDQEVLDAGCGEGFLARILAARGARVTGIDISPRLIEMARSKPGTERISYRAADMSLLLPEYAGHFDAVASYMVLHAVENYRGFATTLATVLKSRGVLVLAFLSPYAAVIHRHVDNYFESGTVTPNRGLWMQGIETYYRHRTLEEYVDAFLAAGLRLTKLGDLQWGHGRFPNFTLLAFDKP